ncbi:uncharacterized protein F4822DRAFT_429327 [Hypoxylon trugodes]|uniref:uncharacterized protein n=1 Tax=Hypoxylon trugodes TaxID=326681 RepID=UPI002197DAFD|nr:uncharacterized protein F4822DRAFT_429327 [Hypoxylon trugodes]KAI1388710.1 hypothetical protein F4822DRAFT_429327 [Hypoxylon trugodes]
MAKGSGFGNQFKFAQEHDVPITARMLKTVWFCLGDDKEIIQVTIDPGVEGNPSQLVPLPERVPIFLFSQLELQKLITNDKIPKQLSAALLLIVETLSADFTKEGAFQTLFRYTAIESKRTYFLFATINCCMESRTYTINELLQLRDTVSRTIPRKLQDNLDVVGIVKASCETMSTQAQRLKGHEDVSSSTESDEILFQGKKSRRTQWDYRGRVASENAPKQPICAPAEPLAQQSEGFQKFFKAVTSPTHIRVTAGGRIVPNTRGSVSPTAKWDKDRSVAGAHNSTETSNNEKPEASNGIGGHGPHPLISPLFPGHPGFFQHMGLPMPMYPFPPPGVPMGYGTPPPHFVHPAMRLPQFTPSQQSNEEATKEVKTQDGAGDKKPRPSPIKIAPRDQFEPNRPFYSNGNVIYPAPYGPGQPMLVPNPYFPHGMISSPAFATPNVGSMGSMNQPSPAAPTFGPPVMAPRFPGPPSTGGSSHPMQPPPIPNQGMLHHPHITSIRPSEITRRQIDTLRESLKYHENQKHFNKHQIDEKWTDEEAEKLRNDLQRFETTYQNQLIYEATYYPPKDIAAMESVQQGQHWKIPSGQSSVKSFRGANASENSSITASDRGRGISQQLHWSERFASKSEKTWKPAAVGLNSNNGANIPFASDPVLESCIHDKGKREPATSDSSKNVESTSNSNGIRFPTFTSQSEGPGSGARIGLPGSYGLNQWLPAGSLPSNQQGNWNAGNMYGRVPYLIGTLPQGVDPRVSRDYVYARELTPEEKLARVNYWGQIPSGGLRLPKFDGKDFYPPSPVKSQSPLRRELPIGRQGEFGFQKTSKAIPIVAPSDAGRNGDVKAVKISASRVEDGVQDIGKLMEGVGIASSTKSSEGSVARKMENTSTRRVIERSSNKSGNDLWQTMLKKGSTSGMALPGAISSTTATGYLPPLNGYAAASLNPSISNAAARALGESGDKVADYSSQPPASKTGENRPPNGTRSEDIDTFRDGQEQKLRRVVGSENLR